MLNLYTYGVSPHYSVERPIVLCEKARFQRSQVLLYITC